MRITEAGTEAMVKNLRAEGQHSRADYLELMQHEMLILRKLCGDLDKYKEGTKKGDKAHEAWHSYMEDL